MEVRCAAQQAQQTPKQKANSQNLTESGNKLNDNLTTHSEFVKAEKKIQQKLKWFKHYSTVDIWSS